MWNSLGNLVNKKKNSFKSFEEADLPDVCKEAINNVYPEALDYIKYNNYTNNTVFISVSDPIWITELTNYTEELKTYINKKRKKPIHRVKITLK